MSREEDLLDFDDDTVVNTQHHDDTRSTSSSSSNKMRNTFTSEDLSSISGASHHHLAGKNDPSFSTATPTPSTPTGIPENTTFVQLKKFVELTSGNQQHLLDIEATKIVSPMITAKIAQRRIGDVLKELEILLAESSQDPKKMNIGKVTKVFDDLSIYFATENMVDERLPYHASVSLAIDGDRLSSTMAGLLTRLIGCKYCT